MADPREELVGRLFIAGVNTVEFFSVYLGGKLGLYASLHHDGPATAPQLAARAGIAPRYAQEWLEQQAVAGFVTVDDVTKDASDRTYTLPAAHAEPLLDRDSPFSIEPLTRMAGPLTELLPKIVDAFRTGGGLTWDEMPAELSEAQGDFNRPWLLAQFGTEHLPSIPDVHARLSDASKPARVADVACGAGWAAIAIAKAYPHVTVDGYDLDAHAVELARKNAAEAGVADRVSFELRDAAEATGRYDLVTVIEAIHDMTRPVEVLRSIRGMLEPGGVALVVDERVADTFTAPGDETERLMYAVSLFMCLPAGLGEPGGAGTGTVIRTPTMLRYATEAGFTKTSVLEQIEHPLFKFYRFES